MNWLEMVACGRAESSTSPFYIRRLRREVEALHQKCEGIADAVRALSALVHTLREALVAVRLYQGSGVAPAIAATGQGIDTAR
jgi:hypothetical protein